MTALLADLAAAGVTVRRRGAFLWLDGPPEALADEAMIARVRAAKPTLLAALPDDEPGGWTAADWRQHYAERLAVAMIDGGQPEPAARRMAWQSCIAMWLDLTPVASPPGRCARCGEHEAAGAVVVPFGTGPHAWLHPACWPGWHAARQAAAAAALRPILASEAGR